MAYVLSTDVEDMDPDTGAIRLLGKRGESLPTALKDQRDAYIADGILVEESELRGATSMTFTELEHSLKDVELTDEQMAAVKTAFEERKVTFDDGTSDDQRREFAHDVSTNLAQVHRDRVQASPAIHRAAPQKVGEKSKPAATKAE